MGSLKECRGGRQEGGGGKNRSGAEKPNNGQLQKKKFMFGFRSREGETGSGEGGVSRNRTALQHREFCL